MGTRRFSHLPAILVLFLFRAGADADLAKAKRFADLARRLGIRVVPDEAPVTVDRCFEAGKPRIPASDSPTPEETRLFKEEVGGDCSRYRRGVSVKKNLPRYGKCRIGSLARCLTSRCEGETDYDVVHLAEVYANGWGVKRNAIQQDVGARLQRGDSPRPIADVDHTASGSSPASWVLRPPPPTLPPVH